MNDYPIILLNEKTDLISVECQCPVCKDKYVHGVPYVSVPCNKCGNTYSTDFKQDILTKKYRQIEQALTENNGVHIQASDRYEPFIITLQRYKQRQGCWDVSEITNKKEMFRFCKSCGVCLNCFTCECGKSFTKDINRKKQKCPDCKSNNFKKTFFKEALEKGRKHICPECNSERIKMTRTSRKTKCHKCSSTKLTEPKVNTVYSLTISRKKSYKIENL